LVLSGEKWLVSVPYVDERGNDEESTHHHSRPETQMTQMMVNVNPSSRPRKRARDSDQEIKVAFVGSMDQPS